MSLVEEIRSLCNKLTSDKLTSLRMQEELLYILTKESKHTLSSKIESFDRINEINIEQTKMLGQILKQVG